jgi:hypothetical protein
MQSGRKLWSYLDQRQYSAFTKKTGRRPSGGFLANFVRTRSERLVAWLQNREPQHYGPKSRIPELFHRRDLHYHMLLHGQLRIKALPPKFHHDLLDATATVALLEVRLGYTFKNRLTCIEALKNTSEFWPMYCDGTVYTLPRNNRLALLGDRVLSMAFCEAWFQAGHPTSSYSDMSAATLSRVALNEAGRSIGLSEGLLVANKPGKYMIAETFEAIIGAIYVDSKYCWETVNSIIKKLKVTDSQILNTREQLEAKKVQMTTSEPQHVEDGPNLETSHQSSQELIPQPIEDTAKVHNAQVPVVIADKHASDTFLSPESHFRSDAVQPKISSPSQHEKKYEVEINRLLFLAETGSPGIKEAALTTLDTYSELRKQGDLSSPMFMYRELRQKIGVARDRSHKSVSQSVKDEQARVKEPDRRNNIGKVKETKAALQARSIEEKRLRNIEVKRKVSEIEAVSGTQNEEVARREKGKEVARREKGKEVTQRQKTEEEAARKQQKEEAARKQQKEEAARKQKKEEEAARKQKKEEEAARKQKKEEKAARREEEGEEVARREKEEEEEAARREKEEEEEVALGEKGEEGTAYRAEGSKATRSRNLRKMIARRHKKVRDAQKKVAKAKKDMA